VNGLIHALLLYLKYFLIVLAASIVVAGVLWLWISLRGWLIRLRDEV